MVVHVFHESILGFQRFDFGVDIPESRGAD